MNANNSHILETQKNTAKDMPQIKFCNTKKNNLSLMWYLTTAFAACWLCKGMYETSCLIHVLTCFYHWNIASDIPNVERAIIGYPYTGQISEQNLVFSNEYNDTIYIISHIRIFSRVHLMRLWSKGWKFFTQNSVVASCSSSMVSESRSGSRKWISSNVYLLKMPLLMINVLLIALGLVVYPSLRNNNFGSFVFLFLTNMRFRMDCETNWLRSISSKILISSDLDRKETSYTNCVSNTFLLNRFDIWIILENESCREKWERTLRTIGPSRLFNLIRFSWLDSSCWKIIVHENATVYSFVVPYQIYQMSWLLGLFIRSIFMVNWKLLKYYCCWQYFLCFNELLLGPTIYLPNSIT